ncbi:MAG: gamma carbonic anhydrase family protein [Pseudomonadales bacterium]|nr:gamma carbonic anhydrase family protein [Gammaproteobacteria bacterium]NNC54801.1 gamma carbonic anhydrase family protein [Pseudomonadales bacterium]NNL56771.1 gamma carbonic anhydrase family protein [Pseudomonadales bacterium]
MLYSLDSIAPVLLGEGHFVAPNASVIGNVTLHSHSSVWFGVVIRGDVERIEIGPRSNVQDGSVLHADPGHPLEIGADVTVGHKAVVHGCRIGDGSLIGINAVVLNGAKIGKHCLIGAGSLVTENSDIADGSVVMGCPGTIVKTLSGEQQQALALGAAHYVDNASQFTCGLQALDA